MTLALSTLAAAALVLATWLFPSSTATAQTERAASSSATRFAAYDVVIDSGAAELAAWQLDVRDASGRARLVGVEGGDARAFAEPPRHDPRALAGGRVVIAAFTTSAGAPSGRARVARLHYAIDGAAEPELIVRVAAAATSDGTPIEVRAELARP